MRRRLNLKFILPLLVVIGALAGGIHLVHGFQIKRTAGTLLTEADKARDEEDAVGEVEWLGRYVALRPNDADALERYGRALGRASASTGESGRQAQRVLGQVLVLQPERRSARRALAEQNLALAGPSAKAVDDVEKQAAALLKSAPKGPDAARERAELELLLGRCQERKAAISRDQAAAHYRQADAAYARAIAQDPTLIDAYLRRAAVQGAGLRDPAGAARTLDEMVAAVERAPKEDPKRYRAYVIRSEARRTSKDSAGAAADLKKARALAADAVEVALAVANDPGADAAEARSALTRGIQKHPRSVPLRLALAQLEAKAGRIDAALKALREGDFGKARGDRFMLVLAEAEMLIDAGRDPSEALDLLVNEVGAPPAWIDYLRARRLAQQQPKLAEVARSLERIRVNLAEGNDLNRRIDVLLARCYERLNQPAQQLEVLRRLTRDQPGGPAGLAAALAARGQLEEAIGQYEQAAAAVGTDTPAARTERAQLDLEMARLRTFRNLALAEPKRDWARVDALLAEARRLDPEQVALPIIQVQALLARGRADEARAILEKARDAKPDRIEYWAALAGLLLGQARVELAAAKEPPDRAGLERRLRGVDEVMEQARKRLGDQFALRRMKILYWGTYALALRGPEVIAGLKAQAEKIDDFPKLEQAQLLRDVADGLARLGQPQEADALLARAEALLPDNLELRLQRFDSALRRGDDKVTLAQIEEIRRIDREGLVAPYCEASRKLIQAERAGGKERARLLAEAAPILDDLERRRPDWGRVALLRATVEELEGHPEKTIEALQRAMKQGERPPAVVRRLVVMLYQAGRYEEADRVIREQAGSAPLADDMKRLDAQALTQLPNEKERALALAREAVPAENANARDRVWLAQVLEAVGQPKEAEAELNRALALDAKLPEAWVALVLHHVRGKRPEEAQKAVDRAKAALPAEIAPRALAVCYELLGGRDRAEAQYQAGLKAKPDDPALLRAAATFYITGGNAVSAESLLRRLIDPKTKAGPADVAWARRTLAVTMGSRDPARLDEAFALLDANVREGSNAGADLYAKAALLARVPARRPEAVAILEDLVSRGEPPVEARVLLIDLYEADAQWGKARAQLLAVLRLYQNRDKDANYTAYVVAYIGILLSQGRAEPGSSDLTEARGWLDRLKALEPDAYRTALTEAQILKAEGPARPAAERLLAFARDHADAPLGAIAGELDRLDRYRDAEGLYRQLIKKSDKPETQLALARNLALQDRVDESLAISLDPKVVQASPPEAIAEASLAALTRGAAKAPHFDRVGVWLAEAIRQDKGAKRPTLPFYLANVRNFQGQYGEAEALYRQVVAADPKNAAALNNLAWLIAINGGKPEEALTLINRSIGLAGEVPDLLDTRGVVYLAQGRPDRAAVDLGKALSLAPSGATQFHLARAYQQAGKKDAARDALKRAGTLGLKPEGLHPLEQRDYKRLVADLGGR